jgi:gliding motility-associated-like protein
MKLLFTCMLSILSFIVKADDFIVGNKSVTPGAIETYTANWPSWGSIYENYANVTWTVYQGTVLSSDKHTVTIQWDNIPAWENATGSIEVYEDLGSQTGYAYVEIINFTEGILETCSGVLGPAAIYENFGAGSNPGPPLTTGSITYQYSSSCNIFTGLYAVSNNTIGCNGNWLGLPQDHTPGDVNGYMLMVDGDENRGEVYKTTATGLTQAFGYEFSVYIANLAPYPSFERPRLQFEIYDLANNLILQSGSYRIEYDPADPWKKIAFMFNLPPGIIDVQIILVNKNNDSQGNDFVVDDISFAPCYPPILASFSPTTIDIKSYTCNNGTVNLYSRWPTPTIPYINPSFKWQKSANNGNWVDIPGATTMNFVRTENVAGIYQYRMYAYETSAPTQFVVSNAITYYVQKMVVNAKAYHVYNCNPSAVQLIPSYDLQYRDPSITNLNYTFTWSPGNYLSNTSDEQPTILLPPQTPPAVNAPAPIPVTYTYNLTVQNTNYTGCIGSNTQTVLHHNPRKVAVPNAFTPGSTTNNVFRPINLEDYPGGEFRVWDRWGNLIFHSTGPTIASYSWNGKYSNGQPCETGNYVWQVAIPGCTYNIINGGCGGCNNPYGNVLLIR